MADAKSALERRKQTNNKLFSQDALRKITTGVDDGSYIEVIDGLGEDAVVITSNPHGLDSGMKVDVTIGGNDNG